MTKIDLLHGDCLELMKDIQDQKSEGGNNEIQKEANCD